MHMYWRVIEELKYLGEIWAINDPAISRRYKLWTQRHADSINMVFMNKRDLKPDWRVFCPGTDSIH